MKRIVQHPPEATTGKKYWRSLNELADKPEFKEWLEREFPAGANELEMDALSRRNFLQLMGASAALAGLGFAGCRRPEAFVVPFTKSVEWVIPGRSLQYATAMPRRYGAVPVVATTYDSRPTKIEGNPIFPNGKGGTDVFAQSSILDLYDPDRSRSFISQGAPVEAAKFWEQIDSIRTKISGNQGAGVAVLAESSTSPTRERLRQEILKQFPQLFWVDYEPATDETQSEAIKTAFGARYSLLPQIEKADIILAVEDDFLSCTEGEIHSVRQFSNRRRVSKPGDTMNRLYVAESRYTSTGGMADHRLRLKPSQFEAFLTALAAEMAKNGAAGLAGISAGSTTIPGVDPVWITETAKDLLAHRGAAVVLAGKNLSTAAQLVAYAINQELGAFGKTLELIPALTPETGKIADLAGRIKGGQIDTLFILGGNPVYNAPADLNWSELQKQVKTTIRLGYYEDETSALSQWHAPKAHYLESWGDARTADGAYVSIQPMILPLFGGITELEILAKLAGQDLPKGPELVQETFKQVIKPADFDAAWRQFVHDGFAGAAGAAGAAVNVSFNGGAAAGAIKSKATPMVEGLELSYYIDTRIDDGRYNNNGWLQELPDMVTKLTWDNAALISPVTARRLKVESGDVVTITVGQAKVKAPILIAPGHADETVSLALGYGRTITGKVGRGVGVNAYVFRTTTALSYTTAVSLSKTDETYKLAITSEHYSMEGRALVREATLAEYQKDPEFAKKLGPQSELDKALYNNPQLTPGSPERSVHQWGMVIDLNTCVGCNACVVACQAENNVPIVGKDQVINGREMHWLRIDRYFATPEAYNQDKGEYPSDPQMVTEPVLCMQCENAPCETVCPVNATVHSEEGLNVMAYNRCIGTRYCANNCPYKVRRFNFFDYNQRPIDHVEKGFFKGRQKLYFGPLEPKGSPETIKMQKNPNVTVRMRGVMEKCTFCVQRIEAAKIDQLVQARDSDKVMVKTDSFQSACQQSCPADAITFGNINDPDSKVSKLKGSDREYGLLSYLNTRPRVTYLARLRNPNPAMPGADKTGLAMVSENEASEEHKGTEPKVQSKTE